VLENYTQKIYAEDFCCNSERISQIAVLLLNYCENNYWDTVYVHVEAHCRIKVYCFICYVVCICGCIVSDLIFVYYGCFNCSQQ